MCVCARGLTGGPRVCKLMSYLLPVITSFRLSFYERALQHYRTEESYFDMFPTRKYVRKLDVMGRTPCQLGKSNGSKTAVICTECNLHESCRLLCSWIPKYHLKYLLTILHVPGMYFWHALFGADLSLDRRQYDPEIPFFLKATNLEREIYDES